VVITEGAKNKKKTSPKLKRPSGAKQKKTEDRLLKTESRTSKKAEKTSKKKEPETMEDLLADTGYVLHGLKRGKIIEGTITEKKKRAVFVDIGAKTEGVILDKEIALARDLVDSLKEGDKIVVYVLSPESDSGQILLSLKKASTDWSWQQFKEKLETGEAVEVKGREVNRGGLMVDASGLQGFVPASQFGRRYQGQLEELINRVVKVRPIEVDRMNNRLIFSEKAVSEEAEIEKKKELLNVVKAGDVFEAEVTGIMPFGIFVRAMVSGGTDKKKATLRKAKRVEGTEKSSTEALDKVEGAEKEGFLEGLVHISEISWEKVEDVSLTHKVGDKIKVKVIEKNLQTGKLNLSIKRLGGDPWLGVSKNYTIDKRIKGKVSRMAPFGVFVNFEPGVDGLIHISKIPAEMQFKTGDEVECFVESVDMENRRMSLGLVLGKKPVGYK
jgi:ribosomal protein S1